MTRPSNPFRYFNSSPEVIRLVVLMYVRFPLSLRNVEDLLFERGIDVCHETVRMWWNRFGPMFAGDIRRQRVSRMRGFRHWRWHLDEMYVKMNGEMVYLWRAVDHEGEVLESYITRTRDKAAALAFMKKALPELYCGRVERPNTVHGLIDKRRELVALLERSRSEIKTLISGIDALDVALRLFGADGSNAKPMRLPPAHPAGKGEFQRIALDLLRETGEPISSRLVAQRFCENRSLNLDDTAFRSVRYRASSGLCQSNLRGRAPGG